MMFAPSVASSANINLICFLLNKMLKKSTSREGGNGIIVSEDQPNYVAMH